MYVHTYSKVYSYSCPIECIELITDNSEVQSTTNVVTIITTAITNTTLTTASVVTSFSASVAPPTTVQITSSRDNKGMYCNC